MEKESSTISTILLALFICASTFVQAQVAINNSGANPDASAMLDIFSTSKGLLIPRLVLDNVNDNTTPVNNPTVGLLIYNNGGQAEDGFYYWDGIKWTLLTTSTTILSSNQLFGANQLAELYENNDFSTPTVIYLTSKTSWYGWTTATNGEKFGSITTDTTNATADQIIISEDGIYELEVSSSFGGQTTNFQLTGSVWLTPSGGSATETRIKFLTKIGSTGDIGSGSAHGLLNLVAGDILDIRFNSQTNSERLKIYTLNIVVNKVGE